MKKLNTDEILTQALKKRRRAQARNRQKQINETRAEVARLQLEKDKRLERLEHARRNLDNLLHEEENNESFRAYIVRLFRLKALEHLDDNRVDLLLELARESSKSASDTDAVVIALVIKRGGVGTKNLDADVSEARLNIFIYNYNRNTGVHSWAEHHDRTDTHLDRLLETLSQPKGAVEFFVNTFGYPE